MKNLLAFIDFSQFSQSDLILLGIGGVIVLFILFKVAKTLVRIALFAALAIALYFVWTGNTPNSVLKPALKAVFKNKPITDLHDKFCTLDKRDKVICSCIMQPIYGEVSKKFSDRDLRNMDEQLLLDSTMEAYDNQKTIISECLKNKKEDKLKVVELLKEQLAN